MSNQETPHFSTLYQFIHNQFQFIIYIN
ncbi:hypothetical protein F383_06336 [Gossypium arboreum]|uniref:Uncharacterized protein n=1 Tax=Gossypium arboreum TaxID=29729 RepID=A0A0B0N534_GOSAR|nr:hypothetical protein F383_17594 [Gossypium arboreum]KHG06969.1 hypothetical protein F383_33502 [Gossypium arboreum]KHG16747.1 hypothetical protein F383_23701 [Gossypium arboreum]KHG25349.1 hypothetical protein F383_06336 [Gossypium arboreum]